MTDRRAIPRATYRVQLHRGFGFDDAAAVVPYLARLGISHLYCSPYLQAVLGSMHGYDVVDHTRLSDDLGGPDAHARLVDALDAAGMSHIVDVVPNHMAVTERANRLWWEVLRDGPESRYAGFFDIDWDPPESKLRRVVLVPILGDRYGRVLEGGQLAVDMADGEVVIRYFDHVFPVAPASLTPISSDVDAAIEAANKDVEVLHELLERQHYRLAYWKTAGQELNYRRFFAVNELVALRAENPDVFDHVHSLVLDLVRSGRLQGLRIDHIDGLRDPEDYLQRLRGEAPGAYLVVEKILELGESLADWPVEGTTGYDFMNEIFRVFMDQSAEKTFTDLYSEITGRVADIAEEARLKKHHLMRTELSTDVDRLADLFVQVCEANRDLRDYTRREIRSAIAETLASFPVYRTYVRRGDVDLTDEHRIGTATAAAADQRGDIEPELFAYLADVLAARMDGDEATAFRLRFQQTSGAVMAKGVEDTLFYTYNRFVALNEVGGDPATFGSTIDDFHAAMAARAARLPASMIATSTHDTKRSDDVRARLATLSEVGEGWASTVERWMAHNAGYRLEAGPDRNDEYLLYQTLVGTWPGEVSPDWVERIVGYMRKASKEAKEHTSWIDPDPDYDDALETFARDVLRDGDFTSDLARFVEPLVTPGWINSLAQALVKFTAPGVPDTYQGQELWDLSLVDPDNRRPVDYERRMELLEHIDGMTGHDLWEHERDGGAPKLLVTVTALAVRREMPEAFAGSYEPLPIEHSDRGFGFVRGGRVVTLVPRWPVGGVDHDGVAHLPGGVWRDRFTGAHHEGALRLADAFAGFPVCLLTKESA
ncbi:MAG TPA: malto-oligosyltrehalose synthase [Actinomycetota bacterium]|nr:malto-oligosyltrehalose synthase [Actinomycetota bacterium]